MCGLAGSFASTTRVIELLEQLKFRGRDSQGIAYFVDSKPYFSKTSTLTLADPNLYDLPVIGHNRWASKGEVCIENTHPFISPNKNVILAHNGTLTDYEEIQESLATYYKKHYVGRTDSEVLTDFISYLEESFELMSDFKENIDKRFKGTYAILFLIKGLPNTIHFMVHDVPLYYYEGEFSSDASVFPLYFSLSNYSYGRVSKLSPNKYQLIINNKIIDPVYQVNESFSNPLESTDDNMFHEICEQAELHYNYDYPIANSELFEANIDLIGCGSSYNACLLGKKYFDITALQEQVSVYYGSEYNELNQHQRIFVSQSGETADILEHLIKLGHNQASFSRFIITNREQSSARRWAYPLLLQAKEEKAIAATKTFTATCMMFLYLSNPTYYKHDLNFKQFKNNINQIILLNDNINEIAKELNQFKHFLVLGSNLQYPIAREISLKLKEVANCFAESIPSAEIKHGPISLITPEVLSIFVMPNKNDSKYSRILGNIEQIKARKGVILGIGPELEDLFDYYISIPKTNDLLQPLLNNIGGQLLAYNLAKIKGLDPSNSRNCAKAITVY